jgi:hypothetical protein
MEDDLERALAELLEAVARIPARRLPKREPEEKPPAPVSQTDPPGTTRP